MDMKLQKLIFFYLFASLAFDLTILLNINFFLLRSIIVLIFLLFIPGSIIILLLKIEFDSLIEYLFLSIGLSISFIMFSGLFLNWILPIFGIKDPLNTTPLLTYFNLILLFLLFLLLITKRKSIINLPQIKLSKFNVFFSISQLLIISMSIMGAISLNNGGTNVITFALIIFIIADVIFIYFFKKEVNSEIFSWILFIMSISLLLMYSLRSWHITGWDFHIEFASFQLTKLNHFWSTTNLPHIYNNCLSTNILPTIISVFSKINDEYVFKVIYPLIFSFMSVVLFFIYKKFFPNYIAFIVTFFYISQSWYGNKFSTLARQQIAFLFFALMIYIFLNEKLKQSIREILLLIFGFSMIVSHYTTTFIAIAVFLVWDSLIFLIEKIRFKSRYKHSTIFKIEKSRSYYNLKLNIRIISILIIFTIFWNGQVTNTFSYLKSSIYSGYENIKTVFQNGYWGDLPVFSSIINRNKNYLDIVNKYIKSTDYQYHTMDKVIVFYSPAQYKNYPVIPVKEEILPFKNLEFSVLINWIGLILKVAIIFFLLIGIVFIFKRKNNIIENKQINIQPLIFASFLVFTLFFVLSFLSALYNLERLFLQLLILLSIAIWSGGQVLLRKLNKNMKAFILTIIVLLYFAIPHGFIPQIVGGVAPAMEFYNKGLVYDGFYTHQSEVSSTKWMAQNISKKYFVYADTLNSLKLYSFSYTITSKNDILPSVIDKYSYVYSGYTNTLKNKTFKNYKLGLIMYTFPADFLYNNKNTIYNNGECKIYK